MRNISHLHFITTFELKFQLREWVTFHMSILMLLFKTQVPTLCIIELFLCIYFFFIKLLNLSSESEIKEEFVSCKFRCFEIEMNSCDRMLFGGLCVCARDSLCLAFVLRVLSCTRARCRMSERRERQRRKKKTLQIFGWHKCSGMAQKRRCGGVCDSCTVLQWCVMCSHRLG